jgi:hypothetical protein
LRRSASFRRIRVGQDREGAALMQNSLKVNLTDVRRSF